MYVWFKFVVHKRFILSHQKFVSLIVRTMQSLSAGMLFIYMGDDVAVPDRH